MSESTTEQNNPQIPDGLQLTPFDPVFYANPYPVYEKLRRLDPIHRDQASFYETSWTITEYATVRQLLRHPSLSVEAAKVGLRRDPRADNQVTLRDRDMMNLDDPDHRRLRALVEQAFTKKRVAQFRATLEAIADELVLEVKAELDVLADNPEKDIQPNTFDLVTKIAKPFPTIAIAHFLGIDPTRHEDFKRWTDIALKQGYPQPTEGQWAEIVQADTELRDYIKSVIAQRRDQPQDDFISGLIQAKDHHDALSEEEIVDLCWLLIGAGNFTTTDLISNTMLALLQHPEAMAQVRADPQQWLSVAIEETLRYDCPVLSMRRFVLDDVVINPEQSASVTLTKGSVVGLILAAANHDPKVFPHPEKFDLNRDNFSHLGFGFGMHHCLGFLLAKTETEVILHSLLKQFPHSRRSHLSLHSIRRNKNFGFRGCSELIVGYA